MEQTGRQIVLVTYADERFKNAKKLLVKTAKRNGFQRILDYDPTVLDEEFRDKNREILSQKRGGGYWLWKPYVIEKALNIIKEGDILVYCDAGMYFRRNVRLLVQAMEEAKANFMAFTGGGLEKQWTKRDIFIGLNCDDPKYRETGQLRAGVIVMRCCKESKELVHQWLEASQTPGWITDEPSKAPNDPEFIENRHDQSIYSLLVKKAGVPQFRDPSQWGSGGYRDKSSEIEKRSTYPEIVYLHLQSGSQTFLKYYIKVKLQRLLWVCHLQRK